MSKKNVNKDYEKMTEKEKEDMRFVATGHGLIIIPPKKERKIRSKKRNGSK